MKTTYSLGGIGGLGLDSKLEIDVKPVKKYLVLNRIKTTMTVSGEAVGMYRRPIPGKLLPRAILTMEGEVVDVRPAETISESVELMPDKNHGTGKNTPENQHLLYGLAGKIVEKVETSTSPKGNHQGLKEFFIKCLEKETGVAPEEHYEYRYLFPMSAHE